MARKQIPQVRFQPKPILGSTLRLAAKAKGETMRKQLLKGFVMLMALMALAMVTAVASANGQSGAAKADVPFEFGVGDKNLPAGKYSIRSMTSGVVALTINSANAKDSA